MHTGQILQTDVMHNLIVCPLQKRGIDRKIRPVAAARHACRHAHRMLLGNAHVKKAAGIVFRKFQKACAACHRRRYGDHARVLRRHIHQFFARRLSSAFFAALAAFHAVFHAKRRNAVKLFRLTLSQIVSVSLLGNHVNQQRRILNLFRLFKHVGHLFDIMAVKRAQISETQRFKHLAACRHGFNHVFRIFNRMRQRLADERDMR